MNPYDKPRVGPWGAILTHEMGTEGKARPREGSQQEATLRWAQRGILTAYAENWKSHQSQLVPRPGREGGEIWGGTGGPLSQAPQTRPDARKQALPGFPGDPWP